MNLISGVAHATAWVVALTLVSGPPEAVAREAPHSAHSDAQLEDGSDGKDWAGPGRTFGEQHFSPLKEISDNNLSKLGLVWSMDLPPGNSVTQPLEIDGVLYFSTGYSIIHALEARSGRELWSYDPKVPEASGKKLRLAWGSRGIAWWNGKIYTAPRTVA